VPVTSSVSSRAESAISGFPGRAPDAEYCVQAHAYAQAPTASAQRLEACGVASITIKAFT